MTTYFSTARISNWFKCLPRGLRYVTHITLADTPQGAMAVMSLAIFNAVIMPIINVVILY